MDSLLRSGCFVPKAEAMTRWLRMALFTVRETRYQPVDWPTRAPLPSDFETQHKTLAALTQLRRNSERGMARAAELQERQP